MTKRELINHLESLDVPDDAQVLIETTEDYGDSTEFYEWELPVASKDANQSPVIVFGNMVQYGVNVEREIDLESRKYRPELESEAAIRLSREERDKARRLASTRNWDNGLVRAYQGDITRRITDKVFASYLKP